MIFLEISDRYWSGGPSTIRSWRDMMYDSRQAIATSAIRSAFFLLILRLCAGLWVVKDLFGLVKFES